VTTTLSTGVLLVFLFAVLVAYLVPFIQEQMLKKLTLPLDWQSWRGLASVLLPFVVLFLVGQAFKLEAGNGLAYFVFGALVPFAISRSGLPPRLVGIMLLAIGVLLTLFLPDALAGVKLYAILAGLMVWKTAENLLWSKTPSLEDLLPALVWMVGTAWIKAALPDSQVSARESFLLAALSAGLLLRLIQSPFLGGDRLYLKRICLATSGGLALLIMTTKLLLAPALAPLAGLAGAGMFLTYLFDEIQAQSEKSTRAAEALKILILIGIFTLLAARLFGTFGWLVLAAATIISTRPGAAVYAGMFWIVRTWLQDFVVEYVPNVTGINLMHPYCSAALYAGMLLVVLLSVLVRDLTDRRWSATLLLAAGVLSPLVSTYVLHAEPTASLIVASTVAAALMVVLAPALYRAEVPGHESLILVPAQMVVFAQLTHELISAGDLATNATRMTVLAYFTAALIVLSFLLKWLFSRASGQPVEVSGN